MADLLLGYPSSGAVDWAFDTFVTYHYYRLYFQDNYKVRSNVSLNLGLRWDVNTSPSERHNRINAGFCLACVNPYTSSINYNTAPNLQNPLLGGLLFAGVNGAPTAPYLVEWNDWQPRFGIAWAVTPKTVVRAGYGMFDTWQFLNTNSIGFSQTTSYVDLLDGGLTPSDYFRSGRPYPNGAIAAVKSSEGLKTDAGNAISYYNTNRRIRGTQHWSFGIQHELPGSLLLDVEYMGSHTDNIPVSTSLDIISGTTGGMLPRRFDL